MQVYYFTRTGNSEKIANEIAQAKGMTANKISDGKDWSGPKNFVLAGAAAAKNSIYDVTHAPVSEDDIIVVFPVWASTLPPAIRGFLMGTKGKSVTAVSVSAISSIKDSDKELFVQVYETKGKHLCAPEELL